MPNNRNEDIWADNPRHNGISQKCRTLQTIIRYNWVYEGFYGRVEESITSGGYNGMEQKILRDELMSRKISEPERRETDDRIPPPPYVAELRAWWRSGSPADTRPATDKIMLAYLAGRCVTDSGRPILYRGPKSERESSIEFWEAWKRKRENKITSEPFNDLADVICPF